MQPTRRPNIVWIISDDTCPTLLGAYGGLYPTPAISGLAARGTRFDRCYCASSVCTPSRFNYLTGRFASRCTDPRFFQSDPVTAPANIEFNIWLDGRQPTIGSILRGHGYRTGFAGKWHNSPELDAFGLPMPPRDGDIDDPAVARQVRDLYRAQCEEVARVGGYDFVDGVLWSNPNKTPLRSMDRHHPEWYMDAALRFLESCSEEQPFFLHYSSTCYHGPDIVRSLRGDACITPAGRVARLPDGGMASRERLVERVRAAGFELGHDPLSYIWLDEQVAGLIEALRRKGVLENTVIVYSGDHNNEPGKSTCYEQGIHIPLIIAGPGVPEGLRCGADVQNVDLLPTLLELAGLPPAAEAVDGRSLAPLMGGRVESVRDGVYLENGYSRAIRRDGWKYIVTRLPEAVAGRIRAGETLAANHYGERRFQGVDIAAGYYPGYFAGEQLYDLTADPDEQHNLAGEARHADRRAVLRARLAEQLAGFPHPFLTAGVPLDDPTLADATAGFRARGTGHIGWWPTEKVKLQRTGAVPVPGAMSMSG